MGKLAGSGRWAGENEGRTAKAPPPETCQLTAMYFCKGSVQLRAEGSSRIVVIVAMLLLLVILDVMFGIIE
jgi:hypothetical protein